MPVVPRDNYDSVEQHVEWFRHLAAYTELALPLVHGKRVLEIGCGAGYGAYHLSKSTLSMAAVDISHRGVAYFWAEYRTGPVAFLLANGTMLPFESESFDVVVSFQVIEHIATRSVGHYLSEIRRVLRQGGTFVCSTPNKKLRLLPFQRPWNPEHETEYDRNELERLLNHTFDSVEVIGLCGSDEVQTIERNRVKQTPWRAYVVRPAVRALVQHAPTPVLLRLKQAKSRWAPHGHMVRASETTRTQHALSLADFRVDASCPEDCLDLWGLSCKLSA
jgi:ubiquinone/menaquinone biosynthesis C-methylase UbiE